MAGLSLCLGFPAASLARLLACLAFCFAALAGWLVCLAEWDPWQAGLSGWLSLSLLGFLALWLAGLLSF
jgi:hypothetical protein